MGQGHFQTNFSRGQMSDKVETRIDTQSYRDGAKTITNMLVYLQGGAKARPGSNIRARLEASGVALAATGARPEPWLIDRDEAYVLVFTDARLDIYRLTAGDLVLSDSFTSQPWTATTMHFMTVQTEGSLAIITDTSFQVRVLTRSGLDAFNLNVISFVNRVDDEELYQPYHKYAETDVTLTLSGVTDAWEPQAGVTVTASADFFDDDHIGKRILMRGGELEITAKTSATIATCTVVREIRTVLDPNPLQGQDRSDNTVCTFAAHGLIVGDVVNFKGVGDATGGLIIDGDKTVTEIVNEDLFTFTSGVANFTDGADFGGSGVWLRSAGATRDWQEPAFSELRGYPQACEFHEGRLWLAGPPFAASVRWGSKANNFFDYDLNEGLPGDAIKAAGLVGGNIRHLVSGEDLEVYSDKREAYMPSSPSEPLTQGSAREKKQTKYGAAYTKPQRFDGSTLFVDAVGQHVRELLYEGEASETYTASPVTALAYELISQPFHSTIFDGDAADATPYAIYTNDDGSAAFFHSARKEKIGGWTGQTTDGTYLGFAGVGERLFHCVTRGGEMFLEEWDFAYLARADGCETLTAASTTSWTATRAHLKSATVDLFDAAGVYLEQVATDASGNFTTAVAQTTVVVGLPATWLLETLPPGLAMADGPLLGALNVISEAVAFLLNTTKIKLGKTTKTYATAFSGPKHFRTVGWSRNVALTATGTIAYTVTVSGFRAEVR